MKYVQVKSLETLPDGQQCIRFTLPDGTEKEIAAPAIMRMSVPDDLDVHSMSTVHLELIPAHVVVDIPNPMEGIAA